MGATGADVETSPAEEHTRLLARAITDGPGGPPGGELPSARALLWFPVLAFLAMVVLVVLGISGSSTGALHQLFGSGTDPDLVLGQPRPIRSDEYIVQGAWTVSQVQQGFPSVNHTFPGGMDATVFNDLPSKDWSSLVRPHVWGLLILPLDQGMAWKWWLPAWAVLSSVYAFVVTVVPRRQLAAALIAVATLFSPILQWWWMPTTTWPVVFGFVTMTALWWALRAGGPRARWVWAGLSAWTGVIMVTSIYVPFMLASLVVVLPFTLGALLVSARDIGWLPTLRRLVPLGGSAVAGLAVLAVWTYTRRDTVAAVLSTVYPGVRFDPTGVVDSAGATSILGAAWDISLREEVLGNLGTNQSEASAPFMFALFLTIPLAALVYDRTRRTVDWVAIGGLAVIPFVFVYWLVPGWDAVAHLLQVDRAPANRMRLTFLVLGVVVFALLARAQVHRHVGRRPWVACIGAAAVTLVLHYWVWAHLRTDPAPVLAASSWKVIVAITVLGVAFVVLRQVTWGALAFAVVSLTVSGAVNPLYRGVFDLRETNVGQAVMATNAERPGRWLGTGEWYSMTVLMETGVEAYNGVQTYPPASMWAQIDPSGQYRQQWNRLGHVNWELQPGEPRVHNPYPDQIDATFDPCSRFAQQYITYLLSPARVESACLTPVRQTVDGNSRAWIYRVAPGT